MEFRVAAKVLTVDEDVGHGSLSSLLLQGVLQFGAVSKLIELDDVGRIVLALKQLLGRSAVRAGSLTVDLDLVGCDRCVDLCNQVVCLGHLCC